MKTAKLVLVAFTLMLFAFGCGQTTPAETTEGPSLELTGGTTFSAGDSVTVQFSGAEGLDTNAWVGLIPSDIDHGSESTNDQHDMSYQYLNGQVSGSMTFTAPNEPGSYDLRLNSSDSAANATELAYVTFEVTE